jgi:hypothetical protein
MNAATLPAATSVPQPRRSEARGIFGWALLALAALLSLGGAGLMAVQLAGRDGDGYFSSPTARVVAPGYAISSQELDLADLGSAEGAVSDVIGRVRLEAEGAGARPVFVGIAPQADVDRYLDGVAHSEVTDVDGDDDVAYAAHRGTAPAGAPGAQTFWDASVTGSGRQTLTWKVHEGRWAVVVMNADASRAVDADVSLGAKTSIVLWLGVGLLGGALVVGGVGAALLLAGRRPA